MAWRGAVLARLQVPVIVEKVVEVEKIVEVSLTLGLWLLCSVHRCWADKHEEMHLPPTCITGEVSKTTP